MDQYQVNINLQVWAHSAPWFGIRTHSHLLWDPHGKFRDSIWKIVGTKYKFCAHVSKAILKGFKLGCSIPVMALKALSQLWEGMVVHTLFCDAVSSTSKGGGGGIMVVTYLMNISVWDHMLHCCTSLALYHSGEYRWWLEYVINVS